MPGIYSLRPSLCWVLELHNDCARQRNLGGSVCTLTLWLNARAFLNLPSGMLGQLIHICIAFAYMCGQACLYNGKNPRIKVPSYYRSLQFGLWAFTGLGAYAYLHLSFKGTLWWGFVDQCLTSSLGESMMQQNLIVLFVCFHGLSTHPTDCSELPMWHYQTRSWEKLQPHITMTHFRHIIQQTTTICRTQATLK